MVSPESDGQTLATASSDKTIKLWDPASGQEKRTLQGHSDPVSAIAFSPDGKTLASASRDQTARLWDVATGQEKVVLLGHGEPLEAIAFAPDGRTVATASLDKMVKLWDAASGSEQATLSGLDQPANDLAFSPDGKTLAAAAGGRMEGASRSQRRRKRLNASEPRARLTPRWTRGHCVRRAAGVVRAPDQLPVIAGAELWRMRQDVAPNMIARR